MSCSSYIAARDQQLQGGASFRHGFMFINTTEKMISSAAACGLKQFQARPMVWMRGILGHEYGVPAKSIEWPCWSWMKTIDFEAAAGPADHAPRRRRGASSRLLADGELDAVLHPDLIKPLVQKEPRVGRLLPNYKAEETALLQADRHLPDHARVSTQERDRRAPPLGADQYVPRLQRGEVDRNAAHGESAHRAASCWYREAWERQEEIVGGRILGVWADRPQHPGMWKRSPPIATRRQASANARFVFDDLFRAVLWGHKRGQECRF